MPLNFMREDSRKEVGRYYALIGIFSGMKFTSRVTSNRRTRGRSIPCRQTLACAHNLPLPPFPIFLSVRVKVVLDNYL